MSPAMNRPLLLATSLVAWFAAGGELSAQVNGANNFAARPALTLDGSGKATGTGSNILATAEPGEPEHMAWPAANSLWWRWTAPATGVAQIDTVGSSFFTRLVVYTGTTLPSLQLIAGNVTDAAMTNFESVVRFVAVAGQAYSIVVDGYSDDTGTETGTIVLNLAQPVADPPPANDNFANPQSLGNATTATASGNTSSASVEAQEPDAETTVFISTGPARSVWFTWTAPADGYFTLQVDGGAGDWEPAMGVYQGNALGSLSTVDRAESLAFEPGTSSPELATATILATAGQTYQIVVAAKSFNSSHGLFDIVLKPAQRPTNDDLADAIDLGSASTAVAQGSLFESTRQTGEPDHFSSLQISYDTSASIWWKWTAPAADAYTVDTRGSDGDTILAVYRAVTVPPTLGGLQLVLANDDINIDAGAYSSVVTFNAVSGGVYLFAVSGYALSSAVRIHVANGQPRVPFAAWLLDFPTLAGADAAKDADPDADGLTNLVELMLGSDPTTSSWSNPLDAPKMPTASDDGTDFFLDTGYSSDNLIGLSTGSGVGGLPITATPQMSADLISWSAVPASQVDIGPLSAAAWVPLASASVQFLRFRIVDSNP